MDYSIVVPLLSAILVILTALVIERVWQFRRVRQNNRRNHQDNLSLFELKADIGSLATKIENQSALMQEIIQDLRTRLTKIEIKLGPF